MSDQHTASSVSDTTNAIEHVFESVVFASRWIQAPLYGGLIVAELLYAYKFLVELWDMVVHVQLLEETQFMLGILGLIDVTMVANLLTMVIIGGYATFVSKLEPRGTSGPPGLADPRRSRHDQSQIGSLADRDFQHSLAQGLCGRREREP